MLRRDENDLFLIILRSRLLLETASLLVHIWTITPLVQCNHTPVNVSGLILLLSQMKVTNLKKESKAKKLVYVNHYTNHIEKKTTSLKSKINDFDKKNEKTREKVKTFDRKNI